PGTGWVAAPRPSRSPAPGHGAAAARIARPAEIAVDCAQVGAELGLTGNADTASVRVVEVNNVNTVLDPVVPVQFAPDGVGSPQGTLLIQLQGTLPAGATRSYHVYFDLDGEDVDPAPFTPPVTIDTAATDEGVATYAITTAIGTYQFDTAGGGFSSLDDVDGNDWINYSTAPGGLGEFRGFPNLIFPENQFHPGGTGVTTTLVEAGPVRVTFDVSADSGAWQGRWHVYSTFATFELTAAGHDYWFLYEGTPGGTFDGAADVYVRSDGTSVPGDTSVDTDITGIDGVEWSMSGDPVLGRSFFMVNDSDDAIVDGYRSFNGDMTVMAFGRASSGTVPLLTDVPRRFVVGLVDTVSAAEAAGPIDSARLSLGGSVGSAEAQPPPPPDPSGFSRLATANGQLPTAPAGSTPQQTAMVIADLDGDGDDDVVIAGRDGPNSVQWYRRDQAGKWELYLVDPDALTIEAGGTSGDVDGDGDIDLIFGGDRSSNKIWWWENPGTGYDPAVPWTRREILSSGGNRHHDSLFADVDNDGQPELVYWTQGIPSARIDDLYVAEVPADPTLPGEWPNTLIYDASVASEGLAAADVDLDGQLEIVAGGVLFNYDPGTDTYLAEPLPTVTSARFQIGQLIVGGRPEIAVASGDEIGPLEVLSWDGLAWNSQSLLGGAGGLSAPWNRGHSLDLGDLDGDGNLDVFSAEMYLGSASDSAKENARAAVWYGDGLGGFSPALLSTGEDNHESLLADIDGDGDLDIVRKPFDLATPAFGILTNQQIGGAAGLRSFNKHVIDVKPDRGMFVYAADLDEDGDQDIITGGWWYENTGSLSSGWVRNDIGAPLLDAMVVEDLDGDGHLDIFGAQGPAGSGAPSRDFAWAKGDGNGGFTVYTNVDGGTASFIQGATTVQFTPGGPVEVWLAWNDRSNLIDKWVVPVDPTVTQWTKTVGTAISQGEQIEFADIDADGDLDLMEGHIWLRNEGDDTTFTRQDLHSPTNCCFPGNITTDPLPDRVVVADMNDDGRLDVVVSYEFDPANRVVWFEQPAGDPTQLWTEHEIGGASFPIHSLDVHDLDYDGDLDVVAGEHRFEDEVIEEGQAWVFENNGAGLTWTPHLLDGADAHHDGLQFADLDNDGDQDIISIGWVHNRVIVYENEVIPPNAAPVITSGGAVSVVENQLVAVDVEASDDAGGLVFGLSGGVDAGLFSIDSVSGLVSF
ncbi:MAG: VCBS repeat-containing protein, partial [Actinomycetota bacterium]